MKRDNILETLGFTKLEGFNTINLTSTKRGSFVENRIKDSNLYDIWTNDKQITIHSTYLVTKDEIVEFEKITGKKYIKVGTLIDNEGYWKEWIKY